MPLSVTCPGCESVYPVGDALLGKTIRCKKCGELIEVTAPKAAKTASAAKPSKPAPRVVVEDDDEDDAPRKPSRRRDDEDDAPKTKRPTKAAVADDHDDDEDDEDDDTPRKGKGGQKKGAPVGLIVGIVVGGLVLVGGAVGAYLMFGGDSETDPPGKSGPVANNGPMATQVNAGSNNSASKEPTKEPTKEPSKEPSKQPTPKVELTPKEKETKPTDDTGTKPTPNTVPPAPREKPFVPPSANPRDEMQRFLGKMDRTTLDMVKRASVFIKAEADVGIGTGSGWVGITPNLVWTNAHVLFMKAPGSKEPKKLTFYLNSGTDEQREIPHHRLKILAVDHEIDLALIQVIGEKDMPAPLKVKPSADLMEGQGLNTIGYPFGHRARAGAAQTKGEPEVSVRPTTYTAPRRNNYGQTRRIQIEGGVYTGNSGGPVVDGEGAVVGVVVEVQIDQLSGGQSQLGLAIPTEYVTGLIAGRIADVEYQVPYRQAGKVHIPVKVRCLDPLNGLNKVGIAAWVGDSSDKYRKPGLTKQDPFPADTDHKIVNLKIEKPDAKNTFAVGEVVMPELPPGRAYWVQPFYGNANTREYWMPGIRVPMSGPPVDKTATDLHVKLRAGSRRAVTLTHSSDLNEYIEGEGESKNERLVLTKTLKLTEHVDSVNGKDYAARLRMTFDDVNLKVEMGAAFEQEAPKRILKLLNDFAKQTQVTGYLNKLGEMFRYNVDVTTIQDPAGKAIVGLFAADALEALQATSIPIPNKKVEAGQKWETDKNALVTLTRQAPPAGPGKPPTVQKREFKYVNKVSYTYIGQRERAGKKEAVVLIEGKITQAPGAKEVATGGMKGHALVELDTGLVVEAELESEFELDTSGDGMKKRLSGINKFKISRRESGR